MSYERYLFKFVSSTGAVAGLTSLLGRLRTNDCRQFLDGWNERSASTVCSIHRRAEWPLRVALHERVRSTRTQ